MPDMMDKGFKLALAGLALGAAGCLLTVVRSPLAATLPPTPAAAIEAAEDETTLARMVSDYIAGMTDRFALQEHARIFGSDLRSFR